MTLPHAFGYISTALEVSTFASTRRTYMLLAKLAAEVFCFLNMILSGSGTAAAINLINVGRQTVFYYRVNKKWAASRLWLPAFMGATVLSSVMTWAGPISLLPTVGSCLACAAYYMRRPLVIKLVMFPATALWLWYGVLIRNPPLVLCTALGLGMLMVGIARECLLRKKA